MAEELFDPISVTTPAWGIRNALSPGAPNPFSKKTTLAFTLPAKQTASVAVYDVAGGTYFVRLEAGGKTVTRNVVFRGD